MILKNLFRRKVRTLLTMLGISIGVAAIVALGALANGVEAGYNSIISGSDNGENYPETDHRFPAPLLLSILSNEKNTELSRVNPQLSAQ